jgi:copper resistance protein B
MPSSACGTISAMVPPGPSPRSASWALRRTCSTAYLGESGQTGLGLEAEYETLFTNRLILQSVIEAEAWSKDDPARGTGSGLGKVEAGLRLRYEFTRRFAPYVGIVRERLFGRTADFREARGGEVDDTRFVIGLRTWF